MPRLVGGAVVPKGITAPGPDGCAALVRDGRGRAEMIRVDVVDGCRQQHAHRHIAQPDGLLLEQRVAGIVLASQGLRPCP